MAKKASKNNETYIIHAAVVKRVWQILGSNAYKIASDGVVEELSNRAEGLRGKFVIKGGLSQQPDNIYIEFWNDKVVPIWDKRIPYLVYLWNDRVFVIDWSELRDELGQVHEYLPVVASATSKGYLVHVDSVRKFAKVYSMVE